MLAKKLSMTLELDKVPRYFIKKVPRHRYSVPITDGTGNGTKKVQYRVLKYRGTAHHCKNQGCQKIIKNGRYLKIKVTKRNY